MKRFGVNVKETIDQTAGFTKMIQGIAGAGAAWKIIDVGDDLLKQAAVYETAAVSFEVMLGSAENAKDVMSTMNQFSIKTPFEPKEAMESGRALMAFGVQQKDLEKTLQMVGDVASGVGMKFNELSQIYGKNMTSGLVQTEDLNQLAGRGIPIYAELAKVFGKNSGEIRGMASTGQIKFEHLQKVFQNMTGEGGKYFGMMAKQSRTWAGLMSTLTGNINEVKRVGGSLLADALRPLVEILGKFLGWVLQNEAALKVVKILFIALIPIVGVALVAALYAAATAAWAFITPLLPFILIGAAIVAVVMGIILVIEDLYQWFNGGESVIGKWLESFKGSFKAVEKFIIKTWNSIKDFFSRYGKYIVMAMFPISALYYYWDEIMAFIQSIPDRIISFFTSLPDRLISALSSLGSGLKDLLKDILPDWAIKLVANFSGEGIEARAGGGPVFGGRPYLVGEDGPELFVPGTSGGIVPNYSIGGPGGKSINVTIAPVINFNDSAARDDADTLVSRIMDEIEDAIYQAGYMAGLEMG
ncbi:MAG: tape measure protein [Spirochaetes bacterium]|nr:tape measure protein [Spirochaetota bacterium]